jgi:hypothetical protein
MKLPIINVKLLLDSQSDKQWVTKFTSLQEPTLKSLLDANACYEKIPETFIGLSGKTLNDHRHDLVASAIDVDAEKFRAKKEEYQNDMTKKKMHEWYKNQHKHLKNDNYWRQFATACKNKNQLDQLNCLKNNWMKQSEFSFYTSDALIEVAQGYLPLFRNYLNLLSLELKNHKKQLPFGVKKQIKNYISVLQHAINKEQQAIAQAMLCRLQTASTRKDILFDDVTYALAENLRGMGLLKETYTLPSYCRRDLNEKTFNYFHEYINKYGSTEQKKSVDHLVWHKPDDNYLVLPNSEAKLVIPKALADTLSSPSFIEKMFGFDKQNKEFFQKRFNLIAQFRFLPNPKEDFKSLFTFYENDKLHQLFHLSQNAFTDAQVAEADKPTGFFGKFFRKDKRNLVASWQEHLSKQQKLILEKLLDYVKFITAQLSTRLELDLDQEDLCSNQFRLSLQRFNDDILATIHRAGLDSEQVTDYQMFLLKYKKVIALPEELENQKKRLLEEQKRTAPDIEEFLGRSKLSSQQYSRILIDTSDNSADTSEQESNPSQPVNKDYPREELNALLSELIPNEGVLIHQSPRFNDLLTHLEAFIEVYQSAECCPLRIEGQLSHTVNQLFKSYLDVWVATEEDRKESVDKDLSRFESMLTSIVSPSMKASISELIYVRVNECWLAFQAKCYGLLISYGLQDADDPSCLAKLEKLLPSHTANFANQGSCRSQVMNTSSSFFHRTTLPVQFESVQQTVTLAY